MGINFITLTHQVLRVESRDWWTEDPAAKEPSQICLVADFVVFMSGKGVSHSATNDGERSITQAFWNCGWSQRKTRTLRNNPESQSCFKCLCFCRLYIGCFSWGRKLAQVDLHSFHVSPLQLDLIELGCKETQLQSMPVHWIEYDVPTKAGPSHCISKEEAYREYCYGGGLKSTLKPCVLKVWSWAEHATMGESRIFKRWG